VNFIKIAALSLFALVVLLMPSASFALDLPQFPKEEYARGKVIQILEDTVMDFMGEKNTYQKVKVELDWGGQIEVEHGGNIKITSDQKVNQGDQVVLVKFPSPEGGSTWQIIDRYRFGTIQFFIGVFFVLVIIMSRKKGFGAILGLIISLLIIIKYIVPQINSGEDPLFATITGAIMIMFSTLFLAHGFNKQTVIALVSTSITLVLTAIIAIFVVKTTSLTGMGSEDAYNLRFGLGTINTQGLLLGGIIIGTLGVLDDITTAQTAAVFEIFKANPKQSLSEVFSRAMRVGREHISSLVNTLILAYAGVSLPIFIFIVFNPTNQPLWVLLNSEFISEEIVRSLVGSSSLILAVPITTILASYIAVKKIAIKSDKYS
jgi:uncharacterized membrane protein